MTQTFDGRAGRRGRRRPHPRHRPPGDGPRRLALPAGAGGGGDAADAAEVAALFRASHESGVPLTFRSGGTSLSGQGVTDGVLADTGRPSAGSRCSTAAPGCGCSPARRCATSTPTWPGTGASSAPTRPARSPAPSAGSSPTTPAAWPAAPSRTPTAPWTPSSSCCPAAPSSTPAADADERLRRDEPELWQGLSQLRDRVRGNAQSVRTIRRQFSMKNTMGYGVNALLDHDRPVDILTHLVVGSEGTLAFIAEATFRTVPLLPAAATGLRSSRPRAATAALPELVGAGLATIELMDATSLRVAQTLRGPPPSCPRCRWRGRRPSSSSTTPGRRRRWPRGVPPAPRSWTGWRSPPRPAHVRPRERAALWSIRKGLYTSVAGARPSGTTALLEDVVVPVPALLRHCESLLELFDAARLPRERDLRPRQGRQHPLHAQRAASRTRPPRALPAVHRGHGRRRPGQRAAR